MKDRPFDSRRSEVKPQQQQHSQVGRLKLIRLIDRASSFCRLYSIDETRLNDGDNDNDSPALEQPQQQQPGHFLVFLFSLGRQSISELFDDCLKRRAGRAFYLIASATNWRRLESSTRSCSLTPAVAHETTAMSIHTTAELGIAKRDLAD